MFLFTEHFKRYINIEYLEENFLEILNTEHYITVILAEFIPKNYLNRKDSVSKILETTNTFPIKNSNTVKTMIGLD